MMEGENIAKNFNEYSCEQIIISGKKIDEFVFLKFLRHLVSRQRKIKLSITIARIRMKDRLVLSM